MPTINEAKRLIKRAILTNIAVEKKDLAITPLISGKHGIGKSQMIKSIADDLNGYCITIEGGTLKEGEITGLPYQYNDDKGNIKFRFLPYYAIERIQEEEKRLFKEFKGKESDDLLIGEVNKYSLNNLSSKEKIEVLKSGKVKLTIIFIDEINRTENTVYKELMNILLTRSVNGYVFPWWVQFVGAMNPSTQNSIYATNEMDPAQLDRFIKIKVSEDYHEWLNFGKEHNIQSSILNFIEKYPKNLSSNEHNLVDEETPMPSPRGWDMVDSILSSVKDIEVFFSEEENNPRIVEKDIRALISAKLGSTTATMFFSSLNEYLNAISPLEILNDDEKLTKLKKKISDLSTAKQVQTCDLLIDYLIENIDFMALDKKGFPKFEKQLSVFISLLEAPTKVKFAQSIVSSTTNNGTSLYDCLFDSVGKEINEVLNINDVTKKKLKGSK